MVSGCSRYDGGMRMSNRDRIAHAAAEAEAAAAEKAAKKAAKEAKPKAKRPSRAKAKEVRMKVIWAVCNSLGKVVETFPYPDKDDAEAAAQRLAGATGSTHEVRATKVPMD